MKMCIIIFHIFLILVIWACRINIHGGDIIRFINDIDNGQLIDIDGELSTIDYSDKVDFYELWEFLNKQEEEKLEYKRQLLTLKHRIRKLVEDWIIKYI